MDFPFGRVAKWQTRWLQVPVFERMCGFKSRLAHQTLLKPQQPIDPLRLDSHDRGYSTDGFVEGCDLAYPSGFRASHEMGIGEIKPFVFVQGKSSQQ